MGIKINGLIERVLIQLIDDGFEFEEIVKSSAELLVTSGERVVNPRRETTYYVCFHADFIANDGSDLFITQTGGDSFSLSMADYDNITIL